MASVVEAPPAKKDQEAAESRGYPTPRTSRAATSLGMTILLTGADIWRISDPTNEGVGAIFHPWARTRPTNRWVWTRVSFFTRG
jgi:hypothetical protein